MHNLWDVLRSTLKKTHTFCCGIEFLQLTLWMTNDIVRV